MKPNRLAAIFGLVAAATALIIVTTSRPLAAQQPAADAGETVLTRGPIHEAFAQPVVFDPQAGITVKKEPPQPIAEMPPEEKPEGDDVEWIGGYWAWDADRDDFLWVSGIWRVEPAGLDWVPGYWSRTDDGWQWVSGYWAKSDAKEVEYLPAPPESLEVGPSSQAPGDNYIWAPGCWVWRDTAYAWRPGHWLAGQEGWIWCPADYSYTPSGYVFVEGFWDYSFRRRGILFAPVYLASALYTRANFVYTPTLVIDSDVVTEHLFVNSRYHQYVFGDYYAANYLNAGVYPWFAFHMSHHGYDPIFAYYQHYYAQADPAWATHLRSQYTLLRDQERFRPARTAAQQTTVINNIRNNTTVQQTVNVNSFALAKPLKEVAARKEIKFETIQDSARRQAVERADGLRKATQARAALEAKMAASGANRQKVERVERPRSPVATPKPPTGVNRAPGRVPPAAPEHPRVDPMAKPQPKPAQRLPKPEVQLEPRPREPQKPEPRPRVEPTPRPKVEPPPRPEPPKGEPKPKPKVEPPKGEPKPKPKDKDKDEKPPHKIPPA